MGFEPDHVETITFDSFTTLVDVHSSTRAALEEYVDQVESIATLWRLRAVDYRMVSTYTGVHESYEQTSKEALEYALHVHNVNLSDKIIDEISSVFYELDVFDDVYKGMKQLHNAGYNLAIVSNGTPELLDSIIDRAEIGEFISEVISAEEIQVYKPHPHIYEHAAERVNTPVDQIAHVATPWYDIYGAMHTDMQGIWINRRGVPWDRFNGSPDLVITSFDDLPSSFHI